MSGGSTKWQSEFAQCLGAQGSDTAEKGQGTEIFAEKVEGHFLENDSSYLTSPEKPELQAFLTESIYNHNAVRMSE